MSHELYELNKLIADTITEMLARGSASVDTIAREVLERENGVMDEQTQRWKLESIKRRVRSHLKRDGDWPEDNDLHSPIFPDADFRTQASIPIKRSIIVEQAGQKVEVVEDQWIAFMDASPREIRAWGEMKYRLGLANIQAAQEASLILEKIQDFIDEEDEETPYGELLRRIGNAGAGVA